MSVSIDLIYILIASFVISTLALIGFITLFFAKELFEKVLTYFVSFAAGTLIGGALFHLLPESIEEGGPAFIMVAVGIVTLFALEMFLYTYHRHVGSLGVDGEGKKIKPVGILVLVGDGIHNIADGIIIASGFLVSAKLGIVTALVAALHEIPQEIGDYAILVNSGFNRLRALVLNYLAALTIFIGAVGFFIFSELIEGLTAFSIPFAAGAFMYIALADLLAEIKESRTSVTRKLAQFLAFIFGLVLLWLLEVLFG